MISGNGGNGVDMNSNSGNIVIGSYIGTDVTGANALGNGGNGIYIGGGTNELVGSRNTTIPQNIIAFNSAYGVDLNGGSQNGVHTNSIYSNNLAGINLHGRCQPESGGSGADQLSTRFRSAPQITGRLNSTAEHDVYARVLCQHHDRAVGPLPAGFDAGDDERPWAWRRSSSAARHCPAEPAM